MIPEAITGLIDQLRNAADEEKLSSNARRAVISAVRRAVLPRPKKTMNSLDSAYEDYKCRLRGIELYRKHIPGYEKLGRWRRQRAQHRLSQALATRAERERKRGAKPVDG